MGLGVVIEVERHGEGDRPAADLAIFDVFLPGHRAIDEDLEVLAAVGALNGVYVHLVRKQRRRGESRTPIGPYNSPRRSNRL